MILKNERIFEVQRRIKKELALVYTKKEKNFFIQKKDKSDFVTNIDLEISSLIKKSFSDVIDLGFTFFSEEDFEKLIFPSLILDPIDGTRELIKEIPECALSLAIMWDSSIKSEKNEAFIYNPFNGHTASTSTPYLNFFKPFQSEKLLLLISRSELDKNPQLFCDSKRMIVRPLGSIAYKLAILSQGLCDMVMTLRDKNIWDIAAGSLLCYRQGIKTYNACGEEICDFKKILVEGPLFWCRPELKEETLAYLESLMKRK